MVIILDILKCGVILDWWKLTINRNGTFSLKKWKERREEEWRKRERSSGTFICGIGESEFRMRMIVGVGVYSLK